MARRNIDGFHKGHAAMLPYLLSIKLLKPRIIMLDTCCGGDEIPPLDDEILEYRECFHAADGKVVLYPARGDSTDI